MDKNSKYIPKQKGNSKSKPTLPVQQVPDDASNNIRLSFDRFYLYSVCDKSLLFNNYYRDSDHLLLVLVGFINGFMKEMSSISRTEFLANIAKKNQMHIHKITNKNIEKVEKLLGLYDMPSALITQWVEGEHIYQVEAKSDISAARVVCTLADRLLYPLFLDVNHHVYFNNDKTKEAGSMDYHFCPRKESHLCESNNNNFCFYGQYLDLNKLSVSLEYEVSSEDI